MDASTFLGLKELDTKRGNVSLAMMEKMLHYTERLWIMQDVVSWLEYLSNLVFHIKRSRDLWL